MRNNTHTHTNQKYKQLKCIKYLRISVKKLKKEVGRRSVPLAREERRDRDPAARVAWAGDRWLRAWMGEGRQRLLRKCGGTGMKMKYSDLLYVKRAVEEICRKQRVWLCSDRGTHVCVFIYQNAHYPAVGPTSYLLKCTLPSHGTTNYLPKCTDSRFQRWKQKLKTHPTTLLNRGTH